MNTAYLLSSIGVMAAVTYIIRATPLIIFRKKIKNKWIQSFLYYVPYVVLSSMTFPAVFYSTGSLLSAIGGCVAAVVLAYFRKSLLTVACGAAVVAFIVQILGL